MSGPNIDSQDVIDCFNKCAPYYEASRSDFPVDWSKQALGITLIALGALSLFAAAFLPSNTRIFNGAGLVVFSFVAVQLGYEIYHSADPIPLEMLARSNYIVERCREQLNFCESTD